MIILSGEHITERHEVRRSSAVFGKLTGETTLTSIDAFGFHWSSGASSQGWSGTTKLPASADAERTVLAVLGAVAGACCQGHVVLVYKLDAGWNRDSLHALHDGLVEECSLFLVTHRGVHLEENFQHLRAV